MKPVRNGLQWKALSGLILLAVVTVGSHLLNNHLYTTSVQRLTLLGELRRLETVGESLLARGIHYVNNAARDYETYARDVALFKRELIGDVERFDTSLRALSERLAGDPGLAVLRLAAGVSELEGAWTTYREGFAEKLGPDPDEPRLEWGSEFVVEHQPRINELVHELVAGFQAASERDNRAARLGGATAALLSVLIALGALAWFYYGVSQRIRRTVEGCQRVASGDFGYQMPVDSRDELGQLAEAFNSLSSRTRLVLSLLEHLQQRTSLAASFTALANDSASYLPAEWLGLLEVTETGNDGTVRFARSSANPAELVNQRVSLLGLFDRCDFAEAAVTNLPDLRRHAVEHAESRLVRELVRHGFRSALLVPLNARHEWRGLLVFASKQVDAYDDDQIRLLGRLVPMLSTGLARNAGSAPAGTYRQPPLVEAAE